MRSLPSKSKAKVKCSHCKGKGIRDVLQITPSIPFGFYVTITCETCNGKGYKLL